MTDSFVDSSYRTSNPRANTEYGEARPTIRRVGEARPTTRRVGEARPTTRRVGQASPYSESLCWLQEPKESVLRTGDVGSVEWTVDRGE